MESYSNHPISLSLKRAYGKEIDNGRISDVEEISGHGVIATVDGKKVMAGNIKLMKMMDIPYFKGELIGTAVHVAVNNKYIGYILIADEVKEDSAQAIKELKAANIKQTVMLTGDNKSVGSKVAKELGLDKVYAELLPADKVEKLEELFSQKSNKGKLAFVGDGINDAPALTRADMGIAIGAGSDVAIDAADVVLMKSRLIDVPAAVRLSRATLTNIHENLFWAFFYNVIGIPLAAGLWYPLLGWKLNPMFGAAAMSLSSFCVVTNALRLNLCRVYDPKHDRKATPDRKNKTNKPNESEEKSMTKTMNIEGMMCGHCEARVKKALEALDAVSEAAVSHESGTAVVTLSSDISDEKLKETVEAEDYKVTSIQ